MTDIRPIRNEDDYSAALIAVEQFFNNEPTPGSAEADAFDVLSALIEAYENKAWPIEALDPIETIQFLMEARGLEQQALAEVIGSKSRASEVLNRRRALTVDMIYKISSQWHIPADVLVRPYHLDVA